MIGKTLGHYQITGKLGAGGMGEVYRAWDQHLLRDVAVKVLPGGTLADEAARKRFRKEALALSKLNHPNKARHSLRLTGDTDKAEAILSTANSLGLGADPWIRYSRTLSDLYGNKIQEAAARLSAESWDAVDTQFWFVPRALLQAQLCGLLRQPQEEKRHYESALKSALDKVRQRPDEALYHSTAGIAYAGLGRKQEAIREGQKAVEMLPVSREAYRGFYREEDLARILVMVGEHERALDRLGYLMSIPGDLGVGALRLDPVWAPIGSHTRFKALLRKYSQ